MAHFKVLYYLDSNHFSLIEIKRTDMDGEKDKSKLFYWLIYFKPSNQLQKLDFVSMKSSGNDEERIFKQGKLHFNTDIGYYESDKQSDRLRYIPASDLPKPIAEAIASFL